MTAQPDFDRLIQTFLDEGPSELPGRSYDNVRTELEQTRQRVAFGPWREQQMINFAKIAVAAAAVVVVAVVGIRFLPGDGEVGASPTPTPASQILPTGPTALAPGRYILRDSLRSPVSISFDVPAGWWTQFSYLVSGGTIGDLTTPDRMFSATRITAVNPDACHRMIGEWNLVSTADQIVDALMRQTGIFHTLGPEPQRFDVGDLSARKIVFGGRENIGLGDASDCTDGVLRSWADDLNKGDGGTPLSEGQVVTLYIFDVGGAPLVLTTTSQADSSPADVAELESIVRSVRIEP
jgi:hypothetical protein